MIVQYETTVGEVTNLLPVYKDCGVNDYQTTTIINKDVSIL